MKTVFELIRIYTHSKKRYPVRKTQTCDLGLFTTLAKAEKQMHKDVEECQEAEQRRLNYLAYDEESRMDEKRFGHDIVLAYKIAELELDTGVGRNETQSVRTYTADGQPNDECLLDNAGERHFKGRTPDRIRFQPGDIVEVITDWEAELCVIEHAQPTVEDYENNRQYWLKNHKERCQKWGIDYNVLEAFHWDSSDDCYVMLSLGEGDTHFHPESTEVFRPTKPVPRSLRVKLKAKFEEVLRKCE